jgi:hypothetical protein
MAKLADAADLKSAGPKGLWGFDSPSRHQMFRPPRCDRDCGCRLPSRSRLQSASAELSNEVCLGWNQRIGTPGEKSTINPSNSQEVAKIEWALKEILPG